MRRTAVRPRAWQKSTSRGAARHLRHVHRQHVFLWIDDSLELRGQGLECALLLAVVLMPIVDPADATDLVSQAPLGVVLPNGSKVYCV